MPSPDASPSTNPESMRSKEFGAALTTLSFVLLTTLLLSTIHVFDWSVFVFGAVPRAELCGASLATVAYLAVAFARRRTDISRQTLGVALFVPLSAAAFLALEATTLVLCPGTFELSEAWSPFAHLQAIAGATSSHWSIEIQTAFLAWAIATSFLLAIASASTRVERRRTIRTASAAALVAVGLMLLVPVTGPTQGVIPLPASLDGAVTASAAAVPRTGFVCLPAVVAFTLIWSLLRDLGSRATARKITWYASLGLAWLVVLLELLTGRYSLVGVGMAVIVVACVLVFGSFAGTALARLPSHSVAAATSRKSDASAGPANTNSRIRILLTIVFFFSGMAALVYQVVFAKGLALTFGSTSHASTIVLATYMGGLALGSWIGGRWAAHFSRPILGYALAELGIAGLCSIAPLTLMAARSVYVTVAQGSNPSEPWLIGLQLGLGALVLLPPTCLMGLTLPLLTRQFLDERNTLGACAGLLYTANTLGAAVGASVTGYLLLPTLGIGRSLLLAVLTNVAVAFFAIMAARFGRQSAAASSEAPKAHCRAPENSEPTCAVTLDVPLTEAVANHQHAATTPYRKTHDPREANARQVAWVATIQLTVGGFVTFGLETTFVHLLATVAGTSAYAFSLMLFAFLIGLSLGSSLGRKWLPERRHLPQALLLCQLILAVTLLVACRFWDYLPAYFGAFGRWPYTLTFASREFVRFVVCLFVMLPPAMCIGAQFPIAIEAIGFGWPKARIQALGRAAALNTVGNIAGALVIGFVALPRLGSHRTLGLLTLSCLMLSALAFRILERRRRPFWFGLVATAVVALFLQPPDFDLTRLSSGGNIYFKPQYYGRVIDHAESLDGGLTAVAISHETSKIPVKTLLTNGKFQGNDRRDSSGEMVAQTSFAIAPLLHTSQRGSALVIGFGTGTTTRVLDEAGFQHVAVAELSRDIIALSDRHFSSINRGVVQRPNIRVHITDGRNFLLLDRHHFDLISIELSSIWFAGAANLYNDEFYALVEPRLTDRGVLQQWVQLHRLSHQDVMSILVTLRQRFPRIWLYFLGKQGILVACKFDCLPSIEAIQKLQRAPRLETTLSVFGAGLTEVLRGRMLTPEGIERLIDDYRNATGHTLPSLISTDDNLHLEYSTPRGNVREYDESIADNEAFLARFRAASLFDGTRLQLSALN